MATELDHVALANRNHDALVHLLSDGKFLDWTATVAFYKAVHVVEAMFAHAGFHSNSHTEREKALKGPPYKSIFTNYTHLFTASRVARYLESSDAGRFSKFTDYMNAADVRKLVKVRLYRVEQNALSFLSKDAVAMLKKVEPTDF